MRARVAWAVAGVGLAIACGSAGCDRGSGHIVTLRDALARGDAAETTKATREAPNCAGIAQAGARAPDACLAGIATWLGSKTGFHFDPPDQASAATAAIAILRDGHGEWVPAADAWLATTRSGTGPGADALRFAMAAAIAQSAQGLTVPLQTERDARALMSAVARSVPGACDTYARLGAGGDVLAGPPERTADHSPCVQKDLERASGPKEHGRYGTGVWRAALGALALWRDAVAALKEGAAHADQGVRGKLVAAVGSTEVIAGKVVAVPPQAVAAPPSILALLNGMHVDAGAVAPPASSASPAPAPARSGP
jgi:hypothetical protein